LTVKGKEKRWEEKGKKRGRPVGLKASSRKWEKIPRRTPIRKGMPNPLPTAKGKPTAATKAGSRREWIGPRCPATASKVQDTGFTFLPNLLPGWSMSGRRLPKAAPARRGVAPLPHR
jgi:hypothetical protein